jgi:hypothetical protein
MSSLISTVAAAVSAGAVHASWSAVDCASAGWLVVTASGGMPRAVMSKAQAASAPLAAIETSSPSAKPGYAMVTLPGVE